MQRRRWARALIGFMLLSMISNAPDSGASDTPTSPATVVAVDELPIPFGDAFLSPDGEHIAWTDQGRFCIYTAAGIQQQCTTLPFRLDRDSVRWSPDSTRIVMTEAFFMYFDEPDIWVLDAGNGQFTDLTDDGAATFQFDRNAQNPSNTDLVPRWSRDSTQILFVRARRDADTDHADVYTIDAGGGMATRIGELNTTGTTTFVFDGSPDGMLVAYNHGLNSAAPDSGIWIAGRDGMNARKVLGAPIVDEVAFSADNQFLTAFSLRYLQLLETDTAGTRVVRVSDGVALPVDPDNPAQYTTWSPTGSALAYVVINFRAPDKSGLYTTGHPGEPGKQIYRGDVTPPSRYAVRRSFDWATNDTLLVKRAADGKFLLLHLGT